MESEIGFSSIIWNLNSNTVTTKYYKCSITTSPCGQFMKNTIMETNPAYFTLSAFWPPSTNITMDNFAQFLHGLFVYIV